MKAFVSYSVSANSEFIMTLLSSKLREKDFTINTSQTFYQSKLDYNTMNAITESHLFIGIITGAGIEKNRVEEEWRYANSNKIPNLLLVEDTVPALHNFTGNYIKFNRYNPLNAMEEINKKMALVKNTKIADDILPWILGGAILLAILDIISTDRK